MLDLKKIILLIGNIFIYFIFLNDLTFDVTFIIIILFLIILPNYHDAIMFKIKSNKNFHILLFLNIFILIFLLFFLSTSVTYFHLFFLLLKTIIFNFLLLYLLLNCFIWLLNSKKKRQKKLIILQITIRS